MVPIADAHSDFLGYHALNGADGRLYDHGGIDSLVKGGVRLQVFAVWVNPENTDPMLCTLRQIEHLQQLIETSDAIKMCRAAEDLAVVDNTIKAILAIESGESIGCSAANIQKVYDLGARMLSLTWNDENAFAGGCCTDGGIKHNGKAAIKELNRLNMALDVSHINEQGFWEAMELYTHTPCASHSCAYDLVDCPRNLRKEQIDHIIERDGYIGINFYTEFLKGRRAVIDDILRHAEYVLERGGEDTVGLGSDFCGIQYTPDGLSDAADFQKIPKAMIKHGYSNELIDKICYSNFAGYIKRFL